MRQDARWRRGGALALQRAPIPAPLHGEPELAAVGVDEAGRGAARRRRVRRRGDLDGAARDGARRLQSPPAARAARRSPRPSGATRSRGPGLGHGGGERGMNILRASLAAMGGPSSARGEPDEVVVDGLHVPRTRWPVAGGREGRPSRRRDPPPHLAKRPRARGDGRARRALPGLAPSRATRDTDGRAPAALLALGPCEIPRRTSCRSRGLLRPQPAVLT